MVQFTAHIILKKKILNKNNKSLHKRERYMYCGIKLNLLFASIYFLMPVQPHSPEPETPNEKAKPGCV